MQSSPDTPATIQLPEPVHRGVVSLEEALAKRRSVREFSPVQLTERQLSQLLWALQGINRPDGYRTAPSSGAFHPLEVYVVIPSGFYHYVPAGHRLDLISAVDFRPALYRVAFEQESIKEAGTVFVIAAVFERTAQKYGKARATRYIHMEVGHAAQNLFLEVAAFGLGAVPVGAFQDAEVKKVLSLPQDQEPLYLIPVGKPR